MLYYRPRDWFHNNNFLQYSEPKYTENGILNSQRKFVNVLFSYMYFFLFLVICSLTSLALFLSGARTILFS